MTITTRYVKPLNKYQITFPEMNIQGNTELVTVIISQREFRELKACVLGQNIKIVTIL